jgi:hypothetical protein
VRDQRQLFKVDRVSDCLYGPFATFLVSQIPTFIPVEPQHRTEKAAVRHVTFKEPTLRSRPLL